MGQLAGPGHEGGVGRLRGEEKRQRAKRREPRLREHMVRMAGLYGNEKLGKGKP